MTLTNQDLLRFILDGAVDRSLRGLVVLEELLMNALRALPLAYLVCLYFIERLLPKLLCLIKLLRSYLDIPELYFRES